MIRTVQTIIDVFEPFEIDYFFLNNPENQIRTLRIFDKGISMESGLVYFGYGAELEKTDYKNRNINLVCIGHVDKEWFKQGCGNLNLLCLQESVGFADAFNRIQNLFYCEKELTENISSKFLNSLLNGKGIQHILNLGRDILANPIYLLTMEGVLIAKSTDSVIHDVICDELENFGKISQATLKSISGDEFQTRFQVISHPILLQRKQLQYNRIIGKIRITQDIRITLVVLEINGTFTDNSYSIVNTLCRTLEKELSSESYSHSINQVAKETLFTSLLNGSLYTQQQLDSRLLHISWTVPQEYRIGVINLQGTTDTHLSFFRNLFMTELRTEDIFIYRHYLCLIIPEPNFDTMPGYYARFRNILEENAMRCGLSNNFHSLLDMQKAFSQAKNVLQLSYRLNRTEIICANTDFLINILLEDLAKQRNLKEYMHPIVENIIQYDKKNGSEYLLSLQTFLSTGLNTEQSAKILHIHRNTMLYRIRRLEEQFHIEWNNGYLLSSMYISLEIFRQVEDI